MNNELCLIPGCMEKATGKSTRCLAHEILFMFSESDAKRINALPQKEKYFIDTGIKESEQKFILIAPEKVIELTETQYYYILNLLNENNIL